jgi:hypothetical protein
MLNAIISERTYRYELVDFPCQLLIESSDFIKNPCHPDTNGLSSNDQRIPLCIIPRWKEEEGSITQAIKWKVCL